MLTRHPGERLTGELAALVRIEERVPLAALQVRLQCLNTQIAIQLAADSAPYVTERLPSEPCSSGTTQDVAMRSAQGDRLAGLSPAPSLQTVSKYR